MKTRKQCIGMALIAIIALAFTACPADSPAGSSSTPAPTYTMMTKDFTLASFKTTFSVTSPVIDSEGAAIFLSITKADQTKFTGGSTTPGVTQSDVEQFLGQSGLTAAEKNTVLSALKANGAGAIAANIGGNTVSVIGVFKE
jgi:hypothetical protein